MSIIINCRSAQRLVNVCVNVIADALDADADDPATRSAIIADIAQRLAAPTGGGVDEGENRK